MPEPNRHWVDLRALCGLLASCPEAVERIVSTTEASAGCSMSPGRQDPGASSLVSLPVRSRTRG